MTRHIRIFCPDCDSPPPSGLESSDGEDDKTPGSGYRDCGRAIARVVDPGFVKVFDIVEHAMAAAQGSDSDVEK